MVLSRSLRRMVAFAAASLFMACQGTMVAYARSIDAPGSSAGAVQGSCHNPSKQAGDTTYKNTCQADCRLQLNSSSPPGAGIPAAAVLPAIAPRIDRSTAVAQSAPPADPLLRIESPPLAIVHCCLRN